MTCIRVEDVLFYRYYRCVIRVVSQSKRDILVVGVNLRCPRSGALITAGLYQHRNPYNFFNSVECQFDELGSIKQNTPMSNIENWLDNLRNSSLQP